MKFINLFLFFAVISASLSGCIYKMPTDDVICTLPNTNNPQVTHERQRSVPGM